MPVITQVTQVVSISTSLLAAGGIAALSLFDAPELQSQPADRSLPLVRWLFSRGSHIFPQAAMVSGAGFVYLAYEAFPAGPRTLTRLFRASNGLKVNGYLGAALLATSLFPFTRFVMIPNNFALIKRNEAMGGSRSEKAAREVERSGYAPGQRSAEDSVQGKGETDEFRDLSGPQSSTRQPSDEVQDAEVKAMLAKFSSQNLVRAFLLGGGGVIGLLAALA